MAGGRRTERSRQALLGLVVVLTTLAGFQLFVLAESTADFFAWTINPPIAAAFMGAAFWGVGLASAVALRSGDWRQLSLLLPVAAVTTSLITVATLLHLDRFHLSSTAPLPLSAAWIWLVIYLIVPPIFVVLWWLDARQRQQAPVTAGRPLPQWLRVGFGGLAALVAIVAVVLFVAPGTLAWPWPLTPLVSRMTGAFLAGVAATAFVMARERDIERVQIGAIALLAFGVLEVLAIVRFAGTFDFGGLAGWVWMAFVTSTIVLGAGVLLQRAAPATGR